MEIRLISQLVILADKAVDAIIEISGYQFSVFGYGLNISGLVIGI